MTDRLNGKEAKQPKRSSQEWCDLGNAKLIGAEPTVKHHLDAPRRDVHWVLRDGRPSIEWATAPIGSITR